MTEEPELKRLGFIETYSSSSVANLAGLYNKSKEAFVPGVFRSQIDKVEGKAVSTAAPARERLLATAHKLLKSVDGKVDKVVATSSTLLATVKKSAFDLAEAIVLKPAFGVTREDAAAKVQGKWEFVKARGLLGVSGSILTECKKTAGKVLASLRKKVKEIIQSTFSMARRAAAQPPASAYRSPSNASPKDSAKDL